MRRAFRNRAGGVERLCGQCGAPRDRVESQNKSRTIKNAAQGLLRRPERLWMEGKIPEGSGGARALSEHGANGFGSAGA